MLKGDAFYFDGAGAKRQTVSIEIRSDGIAILGARNDITPMTPSMRMNVGRMLIDGVSYGRADA